MDWTIAVVLAVVFLATVIRSAFGFGEALIAVPLLALTIPLKTSVPLAVLLSIVIAAVIVAQDWRHVHVSSAWRLVLSTFVGIPLGLWLLTAVDERIVKAVLAVIIILFAVYLLAGRGRSELKSDRWAWLFGFAAGVLGGAYGMNGPPLVIYGAMRRWSPEHFRATLQGYFLPASLVGMAGYWAEGLWTREVTRYFLLGLPLALVAIVVGRIVNRRLSVARFRLYIHLGLIAIGAILLLQAAVR